MKKRTHVLLKKFLARLAFTVAFVGVFYLYFYSGFFTIHSYTIEGAPEAYQATLQENVRLIAEQKLYRTLPANRSISYHDDEIRMLIMETLPNTSEISIRPTGLHTLAIALKSYRPVFSVSDTHAIAADGTVYKEIMPLDTYPRLLVSTSTQVLPTTLVGISELITRLDTVLFKVAYVQIDETNDIRLYDTSKKKIIMLAASQDMSKAWSNIVSAIDTEPLKGKLSGQMNKLEYLDARFGNKVFYKFTNHDATAIIRDTNYASSTSSNLLQ